MRPSGVIALLASGCSQILGIEDPVAGGDDVIVPDADLGPDADPTQSASIEATWTIVDGYTNDADNAGQCPTGAIHATLHAEGPDSVAVPFDCTLGTGTATGLALGDYDVWIELEDVGGDVTYAESARSTVDLDDASSTVPVSFDVDGYNGFLRLSWEVVASMCGDTEVISAISTLSGGSEAAEDISLCTAGEHPTQITTSAMPIGTILVSLALLDAGNQAIGDAPVASATTTFGGELVDLGPLQLTRF